MSYSSTENLHLEFYTTEIYSVSCQLVNTGTANNALHIATLTTGLDVVKITKIFLSYTNSEGYSAFAALIYYERVFIVLSYTVTTSAIIEAQISSKEIIKIELKALIAKRFIVAELIVLHNKDPPGL